MFKFLLILGLICLFIYRIYPFLQKVFGGNRQRQQYNRSNDNNANEPKRFTKDVGEYVPYEEVKDDEK